MRLRYWLVWSGSLSLLFAQAPPTTPVIAARGVTNYFTQEPAPGSVALGGLVQITGLNLGPVDGATATDVPWPTQLGGTQVIIGGKAAPIYSVQPGKIIAQVAADANTGLVDVVVRRSGGASAPAKVTLSALQPALRTASGAGFGAPWGTVTGAILATSADGLGAVDASGAPKAPLAAFVGGIPAAVTAMASSARPGEFDVNITVPAGARAGDLITLLARGQAANPAVYQPATATQVEFVAIPQGSPAIANLTDAGLNGNFLLATGARGQDGCYAGATADLAAGAIAALGNCVTSAAAALLPAVAPAESNAIGALVGPPTGDAQSGISSTVAVFSAGQATMTVALPSPASALTATAAGLVATLPGTPPQLATIDPSTGAVTTVNAGAAAGAAGAAGAGANPTVNVNGLTNVYASASVGTNRTAVIVGDDPVKPAKAAFAIVGAQGAVVSSVNFPAGWLPLLDAAQPARTGAGAPAAPAAAPKEPAVYDTGTRVFFVLARATDASNDAFVGFPVAGGDAKVATFPAGWFAASCTADIRLLSLDLVGQVAVAASQVAEPAFQASCPGSGWVTLDFASAAAAAIPLPDQGPLRVPSTRTDTSLNQINNYVFGARLDTTRNGTSDTIYVLDGVNGSAFVLTVPGTVNGFTDASVQQVPELNALLAQAIDKTAGDQGLVLFNLDLQTVTNLFVPDGFTTVAALNDGTTVCCLATRKLVGRALKTGGANVVVYDLVTGDITVVANPDGVTHFGPPPAANPTAAAAAGLLMSGNARANTVNGVAYNGQRQAGIIVVRIP
jgi:uncharacterized protein (TIGR03437 family)